jgi:hypothetical protein
VLEGELPQISFKIDWYLRSLWLPVILGNVVIKLVLDHTITICQQGTILTKTSILSLIQFQNLIVEFHSKPNIVWENREIHNLELIVKFRIN